MLDLRYEARDIDQSITSQEKIDQWFEAKTKGLTDLAKAQLKQRWGTMQKVLSPARSRLEKIVADILMDMETRDRLRAATATRCSSPAASTRRASSTSCSPRPTWRASAPSSPPTSHRRRTSRARRAARG